MYLSSLSPFIPWINILEENIFVFGIPVLFYRLFVGFCFLVFVRWFSLWIILF